MPNPFFSKFQLIGFDILGNGQKTIAVNILQRIKMRDILINDYLVFYTYSVKDGESPEIIADKLYGSSNYFWLVLLANDIVDPVYDWPMSQDNLVATIQKKYGTSTRDGLVYAYQTVDHYEDKWGNPIDENTYNHLPASQRKVVMLYDAEVAANDAKRNIRLLDKKFVSEVDNEADQIMKQAIA